MSAFQIVLIKFTLHKKGDEKSSLLTISDIANNQVYTEIYVQQVSYCLLIT